MTRTHFVRRLSAALAIGVFAAGWYAWRQPPGVESGTRPGPAAIRAPAPAATASPSPAQAAAQAPMVDEMPLNVQVERLLATRNPADAYRAYRLVADCAAFNLSSDRIIFDQEELRHPTPGALPGFRGMTEEEKQHDARLCRGMTERERQSRLDYLAIAARAGVSGAAVNFATEGPFGDPSALQTRPDDPLVQAWRATASEQLTQAAENSADLGAIAYLAEAYGKGSALAAQNPLLAYRYRLAENFINEGLLGPGDPLSTTFARQREGLSRTVQDFSPDQRAAELAAARRIAELARKQREQAARNTAPGG